MRVGTNPNKDVEIRNPTFNHQVVVPVYIPFLKDYFRESLDILNISLRSLIKTCHPGTFITVVNNGSCQEVSSFLEDSFKKGEIQELVHTGNIGKMNSVVKGLVGHDTPYVTITDCDVLFLTDWQKRTYETFEAFPKAGVVGLTPQFKSYENCSGNIVFEKFFSKQLRFRDVRNPDALKKFYTSIGWDDSYNKDYLKKTLTISMNNCEAVVGSGHYAATYKRGIFSGFNKYFDRKMGGDSEKTLDALALKLDLWRLTTADNFAYHMGNVKENWMNEELEKNSEESNFGSIPIPSAVKKGTRFHFFLKNRLFVKFFSVTALRLIFYHIKGLPHSMMKRY